MRINDNHYLKNEYKSNIFLRLLLLLINFKNPFKSLYQNRCGACKAGERRGKGTNYLFIPFWFQQKNPCLWDCFNLAKVKGHKKPFRLNSAVIWQFVCVSFSIPTKLRDRLKTTEEQNLNEQNPHSSMMGIHLSCVLVNMVYADGRVQFSLSRFFQKVVKCGVCNV